MDLGFDILKIPRSSIANLEKRNQKISTDDEGAMVSGIFFESRTEPAHASLKDLVNELGESVVLIRTPVGLGSGFLVHPSGYLVTNDHVVAGERQISVTQYKTEGTELVKKGISIM